MKRCDKLSGAYAETFDRALEWAAMGSEQALGSITVQAGAEAADVESAS